MNEPVTSWPVLVVDGVFHQHLTETGGDRAVQLAFDNHAIEGVAAIVDRGIGDDGQMAGVRIDLDLGGMDAVRKCQRRLGGGLGVEIFGNLAALFHLGGRARDFEQSDAAVGADHFEMTVLDSRCRLRRFPASRRRSVCPSAMMVSIALAMEWPTVIAEREPTEA